MDEMEKRRKRNLLLAWISQEYIASMRRGDQSRKPCLIDCCTVLMTSPVSLPSLSRAETAASSSAGATVTSSMNTAMPCTGSWQSGPWYVASWKAYVILSQKWAALSASSAPGLPSPRTLSAAAANIFGKDDSLVESMRILGPVLRGPKATI